MHSAYADLNCVSEINKIRNASRECTTSSEVKVLEATESRLTHRKTCCGETREENERLMQQQW